MNIRIEETTNFLHCLLVGFHILSLRISVIPGMTLMLCIVLDGSIRGNNPAPGLR